MILREQFEKETGLLTDYCTGIGDISGLEKDYNNLSSYCKWLEEKQHKFTEAVDSLIFLHQCEMEGIEEGIPTPEQWEKAVQDVMEAR